MVANSESALSIPRIARMTSVVEQATSPGQGSESEIETNTDADIIPSSYAIVLRVSISACQCLRSTFGPSMYHFVDFEDDLGRFLSA